MITSLTTSHLAALSTEELRALLILARQRVRSSQPGTAQAKAHIAAWKRIVDVLESREPKLAAQASGTQYEFRFPAL